MYGAFNNIIRSIKKILYYNVAQVRFSDYIEAGNYVSQKKKIFIKVQSREGKFMCLHNENWFLKSNFNIYPLVY